MSPYCSPTCFSCRKIIASCFSYITITIKHQGWHFEKQVHVFTTNAIAFIIVVVIVFVIAGVHMYKSVGVRFANFVSVCLKYRMKMK